AFATRRYDYFNVQRFAHIGGQGFLWFRLAMNEEDLSQIAAAFLHPERELLQPVRVRMGGESIHHLNLAADLVLFAEDAHNISLFRQSPAERMLRHVSRDENEVVLVPDRIAQVMQN